MANATRRSASPVFISYHRNASSVQVELLWKALAGAGVQAYFDRESTPPGNHLSRLREAVLAARVVVLFPNADYYRSYWCDQELRAALEPYRLLVERGGPEDHREEAARAIVVALPDGDAARARLEYLPPRIADGTWCADSDVEGLVTRVSDRLTSAGRSLGEQLSDQWDALAGGEEPADLLQQRPRDLRGIPVYPEDGLIPSIGDSFVGRADELWLLHDALRPRLPGAAAPTVILEAGAGFGKTRLAAEYLHRYGSASPDGIFWIDAAHDDALAVQFHGILKLLRRDVPDLVAMQQSGRDVAVELGLALRALPAGRRAVYVVDNVPDGAATLDSRRLIEWCPASGHVPLLVISRTAWRAATGLRRVTLRELSPSNAVRMLQRDLGASTELAGWDWGAVGRWVGHLPMALELLGAALRTKAVAPAELLEAARTMGPFSGLEKQVEVLRAALPDDALPGVAAAFAISYSSLPEAARQVARLLAWTTPDVVPDSLKVEDGHDLLSGKTRVALWTRSFVTDAGDAGGRMHPVMADWLRSLSMDAEVGPYEICTVLLALITPEACADPGQWRRLNACRAHAEHAFDHIARRSDEAAPELVELLIRVGLAIGLLTREQGLLDLPEEWARRALQLAHSRLGATNRWMLQAKGSLAAALHDRGDLTEARALAQEVLDARTQLLGAEDPETLRAMGSLAAILYDCGELKEAQELEERALEAQARLAGWEDPDTLWLMEGLAATLHRQGELSRPLDLIERALPARQRQVGDEHPDVLWMMARLADIYRGMGRIEPARELAALVLRVRKRRLGDLHPDTRKAEDLAGRLGRTPEP
jgi:tetratricopeptide (TPR) repeat protein